MSLVGHLSPWRLPDSHVGYTLGQLTHLLLPILSALCHKRSYLRAKPGNGGLMAPATRNYLTVVKAKFKITGGAGYNSYNPL